METSVNKELVDAVVSAAVMKDGKRRLSCAEAFKLADRYGAKLLDIGRICNEHDIRIYSCQLGCFK